MGRRVPIVIETSSQVGWNRTWRFGHLESTQIDGHFVAMFNDPYQRRCKLTELSNFNFDFHFSFIHPQGLLIETNQMCAEYLFQQDKHYDVRYDTGDKVIQCGRHNDIFKLWLMWGSKGDKGYEEHIDHLFEMTEYVDQNEKIFSYYKL